MKKCTYCGQEYPDDVLVCTTDETPLDADPATVATPPPDHPVPTDEATPVSEVPEGFCGLGRFDPLEAKRLLEEFEKSGIQFQIEKVDRSFFTRGGISSGLGYTSRSLIEIFVSQADEEKALKILQADWKV